VVDAVDSAWDAPIIGKWLQLLKDIAPHVTPVAVIFNPHAGTSAPVVNPAIEAAAPSFGITVTLAPVHDDAGIEEAAATQARETGGGLISLPDTFTTAHRDVIIAASTRHRLPLTLGLTVPPGVESNRCAQEHRLPTEIPRIHGELGAIPFRTSARHGLSAGGRRIRTVQ
jgi:hypothetical protein